MGESSREALYRLIAERLAPGADTEEIDRRITERFEETWAIAFTDLVGFSRRTDEFGILHFLSVIYRKGLLLRPVVDAHGGLIVKEEADSWIIAFRSPVRALECLLACQRTCEAFNAGEAEPDRVELCAGLGYGPVLKLGDSDVWGREVNYASKLGEDTARHREILLTESAGRAVEGRLTSIRLEADEVGFGSTTLPFFRVIYDI